MKIRWKTFRVTDRFLHLTQISIHPPKGAVKISDSVYKVMNTYLDCGKAEIYVRDDRPLFNQDLMSQVSLAKTDEKMEYIDKWCVKQLLKK